MGGLDSYIESVIAKGDEGSARLAARCAPTLRNSGLVEVLEEGMGGHAVLRIPEGHNVVVHSAAGHPKAPTVEEHAANVVDVLMGQAVSAGCRPIAMADVIDASVGDIDAVDRIGNAIATRANTHGIAILNGELAILGDRVQGIANVMGTMISICEKGHMQVSTSRKVVQYLVFDPEGMPVMINSDGVGTKSEFYERIRREHLAVRDFLAMNLDDAVKKGAIVQAVSGILEMRGHVKSYFVLQEATKLAEKMGFQAAIGAHDVGDRIHGYRDGVPTFNLSGSVVSTVDEERLRNPLRPSEGEYLIAIAKPDPNPRSNGITAKREAMVRMFGNEWHTHPAGKIFMSYLAEPSAILYPVFKHLVDKGLATSVYHMSGGAYKGKLAKPLAKEGLFVKLHDLFDPDWREIALGGADFTSAEAAYEKWPMGNDGFVTTTDPEKAIALIESMGYNAREVGRLEKRDDCTGVELRAFNGETVYYQGN
ncbi:hypothetical protein KY362_04990 [Candidatus Woesearchaeota archaeon]|nr:hypothetical protein [Candidatus Woesearchaeota archaeon]